MKDRPIRHRTEHALFLAASRLLPMFDHERVRSIGRRRTAVESGLGSSLLIEGLVISVRGRVPATIDQ